MGYSGELPQLLGNPALLTSGSSRSPHPTQLFWPGTPVAPSIFHPGQALPPATQCVPRILPVGQPSRSWQQPTCGTEWPLLGALRLLPAGLLLDAGSPNPCRAHGGLSWGLAGLETSGSFRMRPVHVSALLILLWHYKGTAGVSGRMGTRVPQHPRFLDTEPISI